MGCATSSNHKDEKSNVQGSKPKPSQPKPIEQHQWPGGNVGWEPKVVEKVVPVEPAPIDPDSKSFSGENHSPHIQVRTGGTAIMHMGGAGYGFAVSEASGTEWNLQLCTLRSWAAFGVTSSVPTVPASHTHKDAFSFTVLGEYCHAGEKRTAEAATDPVWPEGLRLKKGDVVTLRITDERRLCVEHDGVDYVAAECLPVAAKYFLHVAVMDEDDKIARLN